MLTNQRKLNISVAWMSGKRRYVISFLSNLASQNQALLGGFRIRPIIKSKDQEDS